MRYIHENFPTSNAINLAKQKEIPTSNAIKSEKQKKNPLVYLSLASTVLVMWHLDKRIDLEKSSVSILKLVSPDGLLASGTVGWEDEGTKDVIG